MSAVIVGCAAPDWVRHEVLGRYPDIAAKLLKGTPCVTLQFAIMGDQNVADATCADDTFIGCDYH